MIYEVIQFIRPSAVHAVWKRSLVAFPRVLSITFMNEWVLTPLFKIWNLKRPWCPSIGYEKVRIIKSPKRMKLCWVTFTISVFEPMHNTGREKEILGVTSVPQWPWHWCLCRMPWGNWHCPGKEILRVVGIAQWPWREETGIVR